MLTHAASSMTTTTWSCSTSATTARAPAGDHPGRLEQTDLREVVDWLDRWKGPEQIALLGMSMGGVAALAESLADDRIAAVILDSTHATAPGPSRPAWRRMAIRSRCPARGRSCSDRRYAPGRTSAPSTRCSVSRDYRDSRPLLIIEGGQDDLIGPTDADDLLAAAEDAGADAQLEIRLPAGHGESLEACAGEYRDWVRGS